MLYAYAGKKAPQMATISATSISDAGPRSSQSMFRHNLLGGKGEVACITTCHHGWKCANYVPLTPYESLQKGRDFLSFDRQILLPIHLSTSLHILMKAVPIQTPTTYSTPFLQPPPAPLHYPTKAISISTPNKLPTPTPTPSCPNSHGPDEQNRVQCLHTTLRTSQGQRSRRPWRQRSRSRRCRERSRSGAQTQAFR